MSGTLAYVTDYGNGLLYVIDIANPVTPVVGWTTVPSQSALAVSGTHAYTAGSTFQVIDISNPMAPTTVGTLGLSTTGSIAVSGSYAYVRYAYLYVIDISNPSAPTLVGSVGVGGNTNIAISGSYAYLGNGGIIVVDISNPTSPTVVKSLRYTGMGSTIVVSGSYAYVGGETSSLAVFNISNPTNPILVGGGVRGNCVGMSGSYLCIVDRIGDHLHLLDLSNPSSPVVVGSVAGLGYTYGTDIVGTTAYVASGAHVVYAIDLSQPTSPRIMGSLGPPNGTYQVDATGSYLYVTGWPGLSILPTQCLTTTAVQPDEGGTSTATLRQGFPNPFGMGAITIPFALPRPGWGQLRIMDISGRQVRLLMNQEVGAGESQALWDGRDDRGEVVPAGVYFYTIETPGFKATRRLVKLR